MRTKLLLLLLFSYLSTNAQCWKEATSGYNFNVAMQNDNSLWSWGSNKEGQSGDGTLLNNSSPKKIGTDTDWKTVVTGTDHAVALKKDGSLWTWGSNKNGQLGDGTNVNKNTPKQIGSATDWQTIAAGNQYTVAIKKDGTLWAWGDNTFGQLGNGTSSGPNIPKQVGTDKDWKTITVGYRHTIALKTDGSLWTWGSNDDGKLGDGTTKNAYSPKKIGSDTDWKTICGGGSHSLAIKTDGSLWAWGQNTYGELGNGTTIDSYIPIKIGTSTDWKTLGAAGDHSIAIKTDGSLWTWGDNSHNELGNGTYVNSLKPVQIGTGKSWQAVTAGWYYTTAVSTDGVMWTFGNNTDGQLGDGTTINKNVPVIVPCSDMLSLNINAVNVTCLGMHNGSAIAIAGGGTAPYTYLWSNGGTSSSVKDLAPGTYTYKATDASSLTTILAFTITEPNLISFVTTSINACNSNNGSISIIANGGTKPYQYSISELGGFQNSNIFNNLSSGSYSVVVKDANGCITKSDLVIINSNTPQPPTANSQTFDNGATVADLVASGTNIKWYANPVSSNALSLSTVLQTGTYYASQTINGCESSSRLAITIIIKPIQIDDKIPTNGLVVYYPFNGNGNDVSGNKSHGNVYNAALTTDRFGNINSAYNFNGLTDYINAPIPNIPQGNSPRTISGWFKTDPSAFADPNKFETSIFNYGALENLQRLSLSIYSKGYLNITTGPNFSSNDFYLNNFNYADGIWYFFTLTYDGDTISIYINSQLIDKKAVKLNTTTNNFFRIGQRLPDNKNEAFKGKIDDIGIWNRVLTPQEIAALYTPGEQPTYTLIPDPSFEQKLINLGLDNFPRDGKILTSNVNTLTSLDVSKSNISDLTGIQDFVSLTNLNCSQNSLKALNVSKNTALTVLDCNNNQIANLDVSNNLDLTDLVCYSNKLNSLDVKKNTALAKLDSGSNQYTSLDVSNNTALTFLGCNTSQLTTLDVSKNTALNLLDCRENKITTLDVSNIITLTELYCQSNQLKDLDISKNKALEFLNCSKNQLTTLDVSANTALVGLYCNANELTNLNLKNGNNDKIAYLNLINNPNLTCIQVDNVAFANTNWTTKKDANAIFSTNCLEEYTLIPDPNFEQRLIQLGIDTDGKNGKVLNKNISKIDHLYLDSKSIKDLTGISGFISLRGLRVSNNQLTTLDLSKNIHLDTLYCDKNKLISLNLKNGNNKNFYSPKSNFSGNPDLTCIQVDDAAYSNANWVAIKDENAQYNTDCPLFYAIIPDDNFEQKLIDLGIDTDGLNGKITITDASSITSLDLSNSNINDLTGIEYFTSLTTLDVSNNQLTTLNLSNNLELETLNASSNQLTTLDLSKNTKLTIAYILNNPLVSLNLRNGNNRNFILSSNTGKKSASEIYTSFLGLKTLGCIQVDDENYSKANWSNIKESTTTYANSCKNLSIPESAFNNVVVHPNPTKGELNIQNVNLEQANVYNTLGQLVKSFTLNLSNTDNSINLSGLPKGIYYVYLINKDAASAKKVIVE